MMAVSAAELQNITSYLQSLVSGYSHPLKMGGLQMYWLLLSATFKLSIGVLMTLWCLC